MYQYGVSYNCKLVSFNPYRVKGVGGGEEGATTVDYVGNDLNKIEQHLLDEQENDNHFRVVNSHEYVGMTVDNLGDDVVSVIVDDSNYVLCVIFKHPNTPKIIE